MPGVRNGRRSSAARITRDLDQAATVARRRFAESVKSRSVKTSFDVVGGAEVIASLIRADDIVAIIEPTHPGERMTRQFHPARLDAAFETAAGILIVPQRIVRATGPIMAVAADPGDPTIRVALEIAAALTERLVVLTRSGALLSPELQTDANQLGVHLEQIAFNGPPGDVSALRHLSARAKERLRVVTRSELPEDALRLFSMLGGVPLLAVKPARAERATERQQEVH